mgnify:CR=1 FL=1
MALPITHRLKRVKSPNKQTKGTDPVVLKGVTPGKDKIIPSTDGTPPIPKVTHEEAYAKRLPEYKSLSFDEYIEVAKEDELYGTSGSPGKPPTPNVVVKGEGVDYDGTAKIETQGDVLHAYETRDLSRGTKKVTKDVTDTKRKIDKTTRRQQKMLDKYDTVGKDGKKDGKIDATERKEMSTGFLGFGNKQAKHDRLKRRSEENTSRLEINEAAVKRNKITRASGRKAGTTDVRTGERDMTMSELEKNADSVKVQDAHLKKNAEIDAKRKADAKKKADAKNKEITISSDEENGEEKLASGYSGQAHHAINPQSALAMRKGGVGKMKASSFKMKGSMFNKNY